MYIDRDMKETSISDVTGFLRTFCLFSVWHSRVHYSATRTSFATIFDASGSPIHRLSYAVPFMSIVVVVAEKDSGKVHGLGFYHRTSLKTQMLGKILEL